MPMYVVVGKALLTIPGSFPKKVWSRILAYHIVNFVLLSPEEVVRNRVRFNYSVFPTFKKISFFVELKYRDKLALSLKVK